MRLFPAAAKRKETHPVLALYPAAAKPRGVKKKNFTIPVLMQKIHKTAPARAGKGEILEEAQAEFPEDKMAAIRLQKEE
jgi:hypothetical protein